MLEVIMFPQRMAHFVALFFFPPSHIYGKENIITVVIL